MKKLTFILLTCFFTSAFGQEITFTFTELEKGIKNFDAFIATAIQKGFSIHNRKENTKQTFTFLVYEFDNPDKPPMSSEEYIDWLLEGHNSSYFTIDVTHIHTKPDSAAGFINLFFYDGDKSNYRDLFESITEEIKSRCEKPNVKYLEDLGIYVSCYSYHNKSATFCFWVEHRVFGEGEVREFSRREYTIQVNNLRK